jgi:NAD(P)-dependent dehydrogenase (short-subunit alcohol dehydrogenase family)
VKAVLDEMLSPAIAERLREQGHDVIAVVERADLRSLSDADQLAAAVAERRAMVTLDWVDYLQLDRDYRASGRNHAGIVLVPARFREDAVGPLVKALAKFLADGPPYESFVIWLSS